MLQGRGEVPLGQRIFCLMKAQSMTLKLPLSMLNEERFESYKLFPFIFDESSEAKVNTEPASAVDKPVLN